MANIAKGWICCHLLKQKGATCKVNMPLVGGGVQVTSVGERQEPTQSGSRKADLVFDYRDAVRYPLEEAGIGVVFGRFNCPNRERIDSM